MWHLLDGLIEKCSRICLLLSGVTLVIMGITVTTAVVQRYFFHKPSDIMYELTMMFMIVSAVMAIPAVERMGKNIRVDLMVHFYPKTATLFLFNIIAPILGLIYTSILVYKGFEAGLYSLSINETSYSVWAELLWPIKLTIPVFFTFLFIILIVSLIHGIRIYANRNKIQIPSQGAIADIDHSS